MPRLVASTIRAFDVRRLTRSAQFIPATEYVADKLLDEPADKATRDAYAERGFSHVPATAILMERARNRRAKRRRHSVRRLRQAVGLGKFEACLMQPMANIHYVLAPAGIIQKKDLPPRWGLPVTGRAASAWSSARNGRSARRSTSSAPSPAP